MFFEISILQSIRSGSTQVPQSAATAAISSDAERKRVSSTFATDHQLTIMLLTVCIVAVILQTPSIAVFRIKDYHSDEEQIQLQDVLHVLKVFSTLNFAINFILYFFSGSSFRIHAVRLLRRLRQCSCCLDVQTGSRRSSGGVAEAGQGKIATRLASLL